MENENIFINAILKANERQKIIVNEILPELAEIAATGAGFNLIIVKEGGCKLLGISSRRDDIAVMIAAVQNVLQQQKDKEKFKAVIMAIIDTPEGDSIEIDSNDFLNPSGK